MEILVFFVIAGVVMLGNHLANRDQDDEYRGSATILSPPELPEKGNDSWDDEQFHSRSLGPLSRIGEDDGLFRDAGSDWTFDDAPDLINDPIYQHLPGNIWYSSGDDSFDIGNSFDSGNIITDIEYSWFEGNIHHHDDSFSHGGFGTGSDPFDND